MAVTRFTAKSSRFDVSSDHMKVAYGGCKEYKKYFGGLRMDLQEVSRFLHENASDPLGRNSVRKYSVTVGFKDYAFNNQDKDVRVGILAPPPGLWGWNSSKPVWSLALPASST